MTTKRYELFLIGDHPVMRRELRRLLKRQADLEVVGEAVSAEEALTQLQTLKPHLLLVDLSLPGMNGLELIRSCGKNGRSCTSLLTAPLTDITVKQPWQQVQGRLSARTSQAQ